MSLSAASTLKIERHCYTQRFTGHRFRAVYVVRIWKTCYLPQDRRSCQQCYPVNNNSLTMTMLDTLFGECWTLTRILEAALTAQYLLIEADTLDMRFVPLLSQPRNFLESMKILQISSN